MIDTYDFYIQKEKLALGQKDVDFNSGSSY